MKLQRPRDLVCTFEDDGRVLARSVSLGVGALLPGWAVGVLSLCSAPTDRATVNRLLGEAAARAWDALAETGLLVPPERAGDTPTMFHNFAAISIHREMLADERRLAAYREALAAVVRPGDVVADAGSGSGALAVYAALAGARRVYAIERTDMARVIPEVADASGVSEQVRVVRGDFAEVALPESPRVVVTETFGAWALAEGALPDLARLDARHPRPDRVFVPRAISLLAAPLAEAPEQLLRPFRRRADGLDLSPLAADAAGRALLARLAPEGVGEPRLVARVDLPGPGTFEGEVELDRPCAALACWFTLHLAPGVDLPTGPADPPTHWKPAVLPVALPAGRHRLRGRPAPEDRRTLLVEVAGREVRLR